MKHAVLILRAQDTKKYFAGNLNLTEEEKASPSRTVSPLRGLGLSLKFILVVLWHEFGRMCSTSAPSLLSPVAEFLPSSPPLAVPHLC